MSIVLFIKKTEHQTGTNWITEKWAEMRYKTENWRYRVLRKPGETEDLGPCGPCPSTEDRDEHKHRVSWPWPTGGAPKTPSLHVSSESRQQLGQLHPEDPALSQSNTSLYADGEGKSSFHLGWSFKYAMCQAPSFISDSATPWTVAYQTPLPMGFSRQEYRSGLLCPPLGIFLTQGSNPHL